MGQPAIVEKLNIELAIPIESERQVVYILAETRKLLDLVEMGDVYKQLYFFCSWALHHLVKRESARRIVRLFDTMQIAKQKGLPTAAEMQSNPSAMVDHLANISAPFDAIGFAAFKDELLTFLVGQNIDCTSLQPDQHWINFLRYYSRVIEDCPLMCLDNSSSVVRKVVVRKVEKDSYSTDAQVHLRLMWIWVHGNNRETVLIYSTLVYPLENE